MMTLSSRWLVLLASALRTVRWKQGSNSGGTINFPASNLKAPRKQLPMSAVPVKEPKYAAFTIQWCTISFLAVVIFSHDQIPRDSFESFLLPLDNTTIKSFATHKLNFSFSSGTHELWPYQLLWHYCTGSVTECVHLYEWYRELHIC